MKANELRIGNLVLFNNSIKPITSNNLCDIEFYTDSKIPYCKPIPLTEEWLLKFGFEKKEYEKSQYREYEYILENFKYFRDRFWIVRCEECGRYADIKYVHELQNIYFALTKYELTMK